MLTQQRRCEIVLAVPFLFGNDPPSRQSVISALFPLVSQHVSQRQREGGVHQILLSRTTTYILPEKASLLITVHPMREAFFCPSFSVTGSFRLIFSYTLPFFRSSPVLKGVRI